MKDYKIKLVILNEKDEVIRTSSFSLKAIRDVEEIHPSTCMLKEMMEIMIEDIKSVAKPTKEKYGWYSQCGFDDEPSGWLCEGGEEAYFEALEKWEKSQKNHE